MKFRIDTRTLNNSSDEAYFDFFTDQKLNIKSITLDSITFYNSWWTGDFLPAGVFPFVLLTYETITTLREVKYRPYSKGRIDTCFYRLLRAVNSLLREDAKRKLKQDVEDFCSEVRAIRAECRNFGTCEVDPFYVLDKTDLVARVRPSECIYGEDPEPTLNFTPLSLSEAIEQGKIDPKECNPPEDTSTTTRIRNQIAETKFDLQRHFNLSNFCSLWNQFLKETLKITHVNFHCDENDYIIIELTEDKAFSLRTLFENADTPNPPSEVVEVDKTLITKTQSILEYYGYLLNEWFGFESEVFTKKGKYYSVKPLNFYRTDLFLRCNLLDQKNQLYNNKQSDILCVFPVKDGSLIESQRYEPSNCKTEINKSTNYLKFEITDEFGRIVNFRGKPVILDFTIELVQTPPDFSL